MSSQFEQEPTSRFTSFTHDRLRANACSVSLLLAAGLLTPVFGGAAETAAKSDDETTLDELTVVGSRIRRDTFDSASPVTIVTREDSTSAGFNSTAEVLQSSSLTSGSGQINNAYGGFVTDGGPGANTISLRGLGASRTLVLINGRRVAPAGTRGAVGSADLNVLPSALIDRIEILKDGASSIYGSDAVAGVVNVITRSNAQGITLEGQYNRPFHPGGETARAAAVGGWTSDRWNISGSLEYLTRSDLTLADRAWARCNTDFLTDPDTGASLDYIDPLTGQPKCYPITTTGSNGVTINTIGTIGIPTAGGIRAVGAVPANVDTNGDGRPDARGWNRWRPNSGVTTGLVGFEAVNGSLNVRDTFEQRMLEESLISPVEVWTGFVQGSYDLQALGNAEIYGELLMHNRSSEQTGYRQLSLDYPLGSPMIPTNLQLPIAFLGGQPQTGGVPVGIRAFIGFGNDVSSQEVDYLKPTLGIRGDLPMLSGWRYDAYTTFSESNASYTFESFLTDKLAYASNVVASGGGFTCAINLTNPSENCVPLPRLNSQTLGGVLPQAFKDYIFRPVTGETSYREWITSAVIDGPLFDLPYGKLQGVFGIEHRRVEMNDRPDPNSVAGNLYNLTSAAPTKGKDNVTELFTELEVPILADLPFAQALSVNGSFRYTDYDSYGSDSTWKLGLLYSPVKWASLRASAGTSYRAPALFEQFQGATTGFLSQANDPCNDYGSKSAIRQANCSAVIPANPAFQATQGVTVFSEGGAAAGLEAETSDALTVGFILQPKLGQFGDISLAVDFFDIRVDNQVEQLGAGNILSLCYDDPSFDPTAGYCRLVDRRGSAEAYRLYVSNAYVNIASQVSRGFDFTLRYEKDIGTGNFVFRTEATRFKKQANKLFADELFDDLNGNVGTPKTAGFVDATYTIGTWRYRYGIDFLGKTDSTEWLGEDPTDTVYDFKVGTYITHFASVRYKDKDWEVTVGARNLFDKDPPMISSGYYNRIGNAPLYSGYDYIGRTAFVVVAKKF
jgi:iron complex outermembrane recepter protein